MRALLVTSLLIVAAQVQAAYPFQVSCSGKTADNRYQIKIAMKGIEAAVPGTRKVEFNASINVNASTPEGNIVMRDLKYRGTKLVTDAGLVSYNVKMDINQRGYRVFAVGAANKYDPLATFLDSNYNGPEYHIKCTGVK
jgi:hypothetical protein